MRNWRDVLDQVGVLSADQLQRVFHLSLADLPADPLLVFNQNAVWSRRHFGRGKKLIHRLLLAESFLALDPWIVESKVPPSGPVLPDAIWHLKDTPCPLLVEVDTGKETRAQWQKKLQRYQTASPPMPSALLVVAQGGAVRLQRLTTWLSDTPLGIPARIQSIEELKSDPQGVVQWAKAIIPLKPLSDPRIPSDPVRPLWYQWPDGRLADQLPDGWQPGTREIQAGRDVIRLVRRPRLLIVKRNGPHNH